MLKTALILVQLLRGAADSQAAQVPYTDPVGECVPHMVALPADERSAGEGAEPTNQPPACEETWGADSPHCRLRAPPPPSEMRVELTHERFVCIAAATELVPPAGVSYRSRIADDVVRDGFRRRVDRPPR
jgi:hypothetical protein